MSPVLIVGGGPTGLTAALELAQRDVFSIVLDAARPRGDGSRAIAIHRTALVVWERLGCVGPMLAEGVAWRARRTFYRGRELYAQLMPEPAAGDLPTFLNLPQYRLEELLLSRTDADPRVDVRWDHRVVGVAQDSDGVTLDIDTPAGRMRLRGSHVLACDGARSPMRTLLGLDFPGATYPDRFLIADIRADLPFPPEPRFFFDHPTNPGSTILVHPQPAGVWRIDWQLGTAADPAAERAPETLARRIRGVIGDVPYELVWLSDYRFHQRRLERLRHGRVLFAGDAAHLVSPFGARGMNSAVHDIENLGWKLAAVLHGTAPDALLASVDSERGPAQRHDQEVTDATMRFMSPRTPWQRFRRSATLRLSARFRAARRWVDSGKMSAPFTYADSPIVCPDVPGDDWVGAPVPGAKVPDAPVVLPDGTHLWFRHLLGRGFVALYFPVRAEALPGCLTVGTDVRDDAGALAHAYAGRPGSLYVIRPDGHLAARRRAPRPGERAELVRFASGGPVRSAVASTPRQRVSPTPVHPRHSPR
jgi:2-polyprenyl-6-methoxyphenol hydroxylase-like FAD-dependent oxidoreductase